MSEQVDPLLPAMTPCLIDSPGATEAGTRAAGRMEWSQRGTSLQRLLTCLTAFDRDSNVT